MGRKSHKKKERAQLLTAAVKMPEKTSPRKPRKAIMLALGIFTFLLYANTLSNGFVLDDDLVIASNSIVQQGVTAIPKILATNFIEGYNNGTSTMYRPFTLIMLATEWSISPGNPFIGHLVNCIFYALTVMVMFLFLGKLFSKQPVALPFLVTLLFAVHPIHTEVVANIKSRDELMSFFCSLLAFLMMMRYSEQKKNAQLMIMGALYFSALMFKESAMTNALVFPLILYFFTTAVKKDYYKICGVIATAVIIQLLIRTSVLNAQEGIESAFLKIHNSLIDANGFAVKSASIMMILGRYLLLLFFPYPLSSDYSYNQIPLVNWSSLWAIVPMIIYVGLIVVSVQRFKKKEVWVFGIIFYLVTMFLYSNILVPIGATIGERFLYTPSSGFCITMVAVLMKLSKEANNIPATNIVAALKKYSFPSAIVILFSLAASLKTIDRNTAWKDNLTLFETDVKNFPNSAALNYRYGNAILVEKGLPEKDTVKKFQYIDTALVYLNKSIAIYPDYGDAYAQRGLAWFRSARKDMAEVDFRKAIDYEAAGWQVYNNMGVIYAEKNIFDTAIRYFALAIKFDNTQAVLYKNLGSAYEMKNDFRDAISTYQQGLEINQGADQSLQNEIYSYLSNCYRNLGDVSKANYYSSQVK